ncbi:MAG: response regulator, partial [Bacteroidales bacterium]|nr:response regulator [Bacteroidales bacterium]
MNFLIVDDEEYNRMLFRTILTRWKAKFDEAADGQQAIDLIRENHYHMVFMDARMPVMDGPEATIRIRNELGKSQENLPVICISATHTLDDLKVFRQAGMNTFLPKPFTEKLLLDTIVKLADSGLKQADHSDATHPESPASHNTASQTINLDSLYHLAGNDRAFVKQLLLTFIESTEQGLQSLHEAIDKSDKPAIRELAHKISSPCKHIGADSLYANFKLMEEQAQQNDNLAALADLAGKSFHIFQGIKSALQEHLIKMEVQ